MTMYYDSRRDERVTPDQLRLRGKRMDPDSLVKRGILPLDDSAPADADLYELADTGETEVLNGVAYPVWSRTPRDLDVVLPALKARVATRRWEVEVGGVNWSGYPVATDRESQAKLVSEYTAARDSIREAGAAWKMADGSFAVLDDAQMLSMCGAVRAHISAAFTREGEIVALISAASDSAEAITTFETEIQSGWPPTLADAED